MNDVNEARPPAVPVVPFEKQLRLAEAFAKSGLFGVKTADQALTLMALCESEGIHPARAVQDYHIVNGKPAMKAEVMLARFLKAGGRVEWHERSDSIADATFRHPNGGTVRVTWTLIMAQKAGLVSKEVWKSFPRAMLHARCVSEGCRAVWPQATGHLYTPEEAREITEASVSGTGLANIEGVGERIRVLSSDEEIREWWGREIKPIWADLPDEERVLIQELVAAQRKSLIASVRM